MQILFRLFIFYLICFGINLAPALGQTLVRGEVIDANSLEAIPFCNISIVNKFSGTSTDANGKFSLELSRRSDSILVSAIGYKNKYIQISADSNPYLKILLAQDEVSIGEITVSADLDPALVLFRQIVRHKSKHNVHRFNAISYDVYNKYEISLLDISRADIEEKRILSKFPVLAEYIDSLEEEGTTSLPLFFIENLSSIYRQRNPAKLSEQIHGVRVSGVQRKEFIAKLLSSVDQNFNIYDNLMVLFGKSFISPIADYGMNVYQYNLNIYDTLFIQGVPHFEMEFQPKRKGEYTFKGSFIVNIENYAIANIQAEVVEDINMELIKSMEFNMRFAPKVMQVSPDSSTLMWIPSREFMKVRMNYLFGEEAKVLAKKTTSYENIDIGSEIDGEVYNAFETSNMEKNAGERSDSFWLSNRHMDLNETEQGIYDMVDSLKRTKTYRVYEYLIRTATAGYAKLGPIGLGPITHLLSRNSIEGWRFRFGIRTNSDFSGRVQLMAYAAYGLRDDRVKYGGEFQFILSKKPWNKIKLVARTDVDLMSRHVEDMDQDNVFTIVQKPNSEQRFYNLDDFSIYYSTEFHRDLNAEFIARHLRITPGFNFGYSDGDGLRNDVITSELGVGLRWQYKSRTLPGTFNREANAARIFTEFRKKNAFPVFFGRYTVGIKEVINSDFDYHDISGGVLGEVRLNSKMSFYYNIRGGKIFGTLPFVLLKAPEGNFSYIHSKYLFNNMNILEFVSDRYVSLNFQYFLGGTLFDKIPGFRKLKWREVFTANVFYGTLNDANRNFNKLNAFDVAFPIPYAEAGFGIENIFKVIRIDYIYRITHRDKARISKWGLYLSMVIKI